MNGETDTYVLVVRYTVEYELAIEATEDQARELAGAVPTPLPEHLLDMATDIGKGHGVVVAGVLDVDVCGGYVGIATDGDCFDRVDIP